MKRKRAEAEAQQEAEDKAGGGAKRPRRGLEAWAKNKKVETAEADSEEGEEYYSDSDADSA